MSTEFGQIKQQESVYANSAFANYIIGVDALPDASTSEVGTTYLLLNYMENYKQGVIYCLRNVNGTKKWIDNSIIEGGALAAPSQCWKRISPDAIALHWKDPVDTTDSSDSWNNATWDHDVIVRKRGVAPTSTSDGEIVGYSTVRDQYGNDSYGFIHGIDTEELDYYYVVFAVTRGGVETASPAMRTAWTWPEIHEVIGLGMHQKAFKLGDIVPLPANEIYKDSDNNTQTLHAQIVDFNYSKNYSGVRPNSITFMLVEVLGNMSFDNKELQYALTGDAVFKKNKTYYWLNDSGSLIEFDLEAWGYVSGNSIPTTHYTGAYIKSRLYEAHPSIRFFVDNDLAVVTDDASTNRAEKLKQSAIYTGCSQWHLSNLHAWLNGRHYDSTMDDYLSAYVNHETTPDWVLEKDPSAADYSNDWAAVENGWFKAVSGSYHNVAPAGYGSAYYINKPCFIDGFMKGDEGQSFTDIIMSPTNVTLTDQYVHRYVRGFNDNDTQITAVYGAGTDHQGAIAYQDTKFWIPSYEEIYGTRPTEGINGEINQTYISETHEGEQFAYFKQQGAAARVKFDLDGNPIGWYTRSCDPTTTGRVFYVPADGGEAKICTAHRYLYDDDDMGPAVKVGPAVCFTVK